MPFDGTDFQAPTVLDTGVFPPWSKHGCRKWIEARFRRERRGINAEVILRAPSPSDRDAAIAQLLHDAKGLIEDPKNWTRGTYRSLSGRRCAVGALRAVAGRLKGPGPAWSAHELLIKVARSRGFSSVEAMNDRSSHAAVLEAFDEAIALARRWKATAKE
jgi:hypothetical protein